jgi:hypothetical protein
MSTRPLPLAVAGFLAGLVASVLATLAMQNAEQPSGAFIAAQQTPSQAVTDVIDSAPIAGTSAATPASGGVGASGDVGELEQIGVSEPSQETRRLSVRSGMRETREDYARAGLSHVFDRLFARIRVRPLGAVKEAPPSGSDWYVSSSRLSAAWSAEEPWNPQRQSLADKTARSLAMGLFDTVLVRGPGVNPGVDAMYSALRMENPELRSWSELDTATRDALTLAWLSWRSDVAAFRRTLWEQAWPHVERLLRADNPGDSTLVSLTSRSSGVYVRHRGDSPQLDETLDRIRALDAGLEARLRRAVR